MTGFTTVRDMSCLTHLWDKLQAVLAIDSADLGFSTAGKTSVSLVPLDIWTPNI